MLVQITTDILIPVTDYYDFPEGTTLDEIKKRYEEDDLSDFFVERDMLRHIDCQVELGNVEVEIPDINVWGAETKLEGSVFEKIAEKLKGFGVSEEIIRQSVYIH